MSRITDDPFFLIKIFVNISSVGSRCFSIILWFVDPCDMDLIFNEVLSEGFRLLKFRLQTFYLFLIGSVSSVLSRSIFPYECIVGSLLCRTTQVLQLSMSLVDLCLTCTLHPPLFRHLYLYCRTILYNSLNLKRFSLPVETY